MTDVAPQLPPTIAELSALGRRTFGTAGWPRIDPPAKDWCGAVIGHSTISAAQSQCADEPVDTSAVEACWIPTLSGRMFEARDFDDITPQLVERLCEWVPGFELAPLPHGRLAAWRLRVYGAVLVRFSVGDDRLGHALALTVVARGTRFGPHESLLEFQEWAATQHLHELRATYPVPGPITLRVIAGTLANVRDLRVGVPVYL